ncbi:MAG: ribonuclease HI [Pseudomonadota bacterium]|nr:ribonuclease HI [Pseudomonadota bacterium]
MTENNKNKTIHIYTDGACSGNPGPGGWGVYMQYNGHEKEMSGHEEHTTNNRMELTAVIEALNTLKKPCDILLHTDSTYVMKGATEWMEGWKKREWKNAAKKPVENRDLWELLDEAMQRHTITWKWVKGHAGNVGNEKADTLATDAIKKSKEEE